MTSSEIVSPSVHRKAYATNALKKPNDTWAGIVTRQQHESCNLKSRTLFDVRHNYGACFQWFLYNSLISSRAQTIMGIFTPYNYGFLLFSVRFYRSVLVAALHIFCVSRITHSLFIETKLHWWMRVCVCARALDCMMFGIDVKMNQRRHTELWVHDFLCILCLCPLRNPKMTHFWKLKWCD